MNERTHYANEVLSQYEKICICLSWLYMVGGKDGETGKYTMEK